jgi:hypothetical protein
VLMSADDNRIALIDLGLQSNCGPRISSFLKNDLIQSVPGGEINILTVQSIGHSKQNMYTVELGYNVIKGT